jgi:hypothetical protein
VRTLDIVVAVMLLVRQYKIKHAFMFNYIPLCMDITLKHDRMSSQVMFPLHICHTKTAMLAGRFQTPIYHLECILSNLCDASFRERLAKSWVGLNTG